MQFNSVEYGLFFPLAVLLYYAVPARHRWMALVVASGAFVAWTGLEDLAIALALGLINYFIGLAIEKHLETRRASLLLLLALVCNVGVLGLFKYGSPFTEAYHDAAALLGAQLPASEWSLLLPLGISYYVFQLISYDLEIYWGRAPATRHLGQFTASILFFPKFVAGPIERPHHFVPQLAAAKPFDAANLVAGLKQIGWGLFKKTVVADRLALVIAPVYDSPDDFSGFVLLLTIALYPVQLYNDFSGYTDIALGSARVLGLEICPNFNRPFSARSLTDFWRRWHISLSSWTNDYIFRPLSAYTLLNTSRRKIGLCFSITSAFFVLGVWHGATWNFALFGLLHGVAVSVEALTQRNRTRLLARLPTRVADRLNNVLTLTFYALTCVFFRADSVGEALFILGRAFTGVGYVAPGDIALFDDQVYRLLILLIIGAVYGIVRLMAGQPSISQWLSGKSSRWRWSMYYAVIAGIVLLGEFDVKDFVYVQF